MRCFIAIEIEDNTTLLEILRLKREISELDLDLKPVEDENIHLTLRFLGEISLTSVESVKSILSDVGNSFGRFEMEVKGLGAFPSIHRPRVIWVGVGRGSEEILDIRKFIDNELSRRGLRDIHRDELDFHPHITLARVRSARNIHLLQRLYSMYSEHLFGTSPVTRVKLKQSILRPQGPIYRDIYTVELR